MSLFSVNTNVGAMVALQSLAVINRELMTVQRRISTGLKISSPKDNGAIWAIAQGQRAESKAYDAVIASLQRGQSAVDVGMAAGETVSDLLMQMKEKMVAMFDSSLTTASRKALDQDYRMLRDQIDRTVNNAGFNGLNLVGPAATARGVQALADTRGETTVDVDAIDLSTGGTLLAGVPADLTTLNNLVDIPAITAAIDNVNASLGRLGTGSKALDTHLNFVRKMQDTLDASVGRLVDADLAKESARLQALQVQQQLAIQALAIANRTPTLLLQLFR
ncbi:flagellin [Brevundimonas sp. GCM10030266]|uniref:flagellin n=1 Tax=Brevundimonas sp. GCM10030266 TaxID=3273386 RepID=UPI00361659CD